MFSSYRFSMFWLHALKSFHCPFISFISFPFVFLQFPFLFLSFSFSRSFHFLHVPFVCLSYSFFFSVSFEIHVVNLVYISLSFLFPLIVFPYESWQMVNIEHPRLNEEAPGYHTLVCSIYYVYDYEYVKSIRCSKPGSTEVRQRLTLPKVQVAKGCIRNDSVKCTVRQPVNISLEQRVALSSTVPSVLLISALRKRGSHRLGQVSTIHLTKEAHRMLPCPPRSLSTCSKVSPVSESLQVTSRCPQPGQAQPFEVDRTCIESLEFDLIEMCKNLASTGTQIFGL